MPRKPISGALVGVSVLGRLCKGAGAVGAVLAFLAGKADVGIGLTLLALFAAILFP